MTARATAPEDQGGRRRRGPGRGVFISYRREDASGFAGRLHEALSQHFGVGRIFRDVDTIEPGADFGGVIEASLTRCGVFLAVIGREWVVDTGGRRRLDDPEDWVRREVIAAIERDDVTVIPVLVEGVRMPTTDELPEPLAPLTRYNAIELSDSRWSYDVHRLVRQVEKAAGPPSIRWRVQWRTRLHRLLVPRSAPAALARLAVVAALIVAAAVTGRVLVGSAAEPARMSGGFNIAVAGFGAVDQTGKPVASRHADSLASTVHDRLEDELASIAGEGFAVGLWGPEESGSLDGTTPPRRAASAARLAGRINADVVVYGTLELGDPSGFRPEFFVSEARLPGAEELFGQYDLGTRVQAAGDITRNLVVERDVRALVLGRTRALAEFLVGLSYLSAGQAQPALDHLEAARRAPGWDDRDGKEVLHLLLGNAAARTGDLARAQEAYDRAAALEPEYARARLGQAEVLFQRARADCEPATVDADGLRRSLATFQAALTARVQPALSDVPLKAAFGQGRVHLCLSQALVADHLAEAEAGFRRVVEAYRQGNPRVRELAAESYANLGLVHLPALGDPDAAARYRQAADDYAMAIDVTTDASREAFFSSMRGFILGRLGDREQADEAYRQAIALETDEARRAAYEEARARLPQEVRSP